MNIILRIIISAVVAFALSYILSGVHIQSFITALILAIVLGILNLFVKPILIILTLPITIFTFGLFLFVINALIILLAAKFVNGFRVDGFWWALLFSLLLSVLTSFLYKKSTQKANY
ncbi:MAG TPA: phage holin family protein [Puia sp.]|jgi:putative membrane protein|nr:phage holin family protein [Puia sp.]